MGQGQMCKRDTLDRSSQGSNDTNERDESQILRDTTIIPRFDVAYSDIDVAVRDSAARMSILQYDIVLRIPSDFTQGRGTACSLIWAGAHEEVRGC